MPQQNFCTIITNKLFLSFAISLPRLIISNAPLATQMTTFKIGDWKNKTTFWVLIMNQNAEHLLFLMWNVFKNLQMPSAFSLTPPNPINFVFRLAYNSLTTSPLDFVSCSPSDFVSTGSLSFSLQAPLKAQEADHRAIVQKLELAMSVVTDLERKLGITER
jgi:hypothetical protein